MTLDAFNLLQTQITSTSFSPTKDQTAYTRRKHGWAQTPSASVCEVVSSTPQSDSGLWDWGMESKWSWWQNERQTVHAKNGLDQCFKMIQSDFSYAREEGLQKLKNILSTPNENSRMILSLQNTDKYNIVKRIHTLICEKWTSNRSERKNQLPNCLIKIREIVLAMQLFEGAVLMHPESKELIDMTLIVELTKDEKKAYVTNNVEDARLRKHGFAVIAATLINGSLAQFKKFASSGGMDSMAAGLEYSGPMEREVRLHAWETMFIMKHEQSNLNTRVAMGRMLEKRFGRHILENLRQRVQFYEDDNVLNMPASKPNNTRPY
eukprot:CFRG6611T1